MQDKPSKSCSINVGGTTLYNWTIDRVEPNISWFIARSWVVTVTFQYFYGARRKGLALESKRSTTECITGRIFSEFTQDLLGSATSSFSFCQISNCSQAAAAHYMLQQLAQIPPETAIRAEFLVRKGFSTFWMSIDLGKWPPTLLMKERLRLAIERSRKWPRGDWGWP